MSDKKNSHDLRLILWRHAEAEEGVPDAARALTKRGRRQAATMADWLRPRLPKNCEIIASPAVRTSETAEALGLPFKTSPELGVGAQAAGILHVAGWPDRRGTVVIVGHQPTLGRAAALLLCGAETDWSIKKGAIWWFTRQGEGEAQAVLRAALSPDLMEDER